LHHIQAISWRWSFLAARYRYTSAEVEVVNHNTVKLNRPRVPGGWGRGSHEDNTEGWFHRPWPWIHPLGTARSCTGRLGSFHGTMHTGALYVVSSLFLHSRWKSISFSARAISEAAYGPVHSTRPADSNVCRMVSWLVSENISRLIVIFAYFVW